MLFEEQPLLLVVPVIVIVEVWLRVRVPLFRALAKSRNRRPLEP